MEIILVILIVLIGYKVYNEVTLRYCLQEVSKMADESSADIVMVLGPSLKMVKVEKFEATDFPYLPEEIVKRDLWNLFDPEVAAKIINAYKKTVENNSIIILNLNIDNDYSTKKYNAKFILLRNGYVACLWCDLTKRQVVLKEESYVQEDKLSIYSLN